MRVVQKGVHFSRFQHPSQKRTVTYRSIPLSSFHDCWLCKRVRV